jgi:hypothetical protein
LYSCTHVMFWWFFSNLYFIGYLMLKLLKYFSQIWRF